MLVHALRAAGLRPGWLVGAPVGGGLSNAQWGEGEWLVVEADESDRSMLSLELEIAVLTNVELDHHASFGSLGELEAAFRAFLGRARTAIVVWDRPELRELALAPAPVEVGAGDMAQGSRASRAAIEPPGIEVVPYDMPSRRSRRGALVLTGVDHEVRLSVPGAHNA